MSIKVANNILHKKTTEANILSCLNGVPAGARTQNCNLGGCCVVLLRYGNIFKNILYQIYTNF